MMKQFGIDVKEIPEVEEVVVRTRTKEYILAPAEVSIMTAQGQKTWQVVGNVKERPRSSGHGGGETSAANGAPGAASIPKAASAEAASVGQGAAAFSEADVDLVAQQASVPRDRARQALIDSKGEPAEAIVRILEGKV
jgi:nascent polypeptide-associated complex subunit alpha